MLSWDLVGAVNDPNRTTSSEKGGWELSLRKGGKPGGGSCPKPLDTGRLTPS